MKTEQEILEILDEQLKPIYQESCEIVKRSPHNYTALFNKILIETQFNYTIDNETIDKLIMLYKKLPGRKNIIARILAKTYCLNGDLTNALKYSDKLGDIQDILKMDVYSDILSELLEAKNTDDELINYYFDLAFALDIEDDEKLVFQGLKLQYYINKQDEDNFNKLLNNLYLIYGNNKDLEFYKTQGLVVFSKGKDQQTKDTAIEELKKGISNDPSNITSYFSLLHFYKDLKYYEEGYQLIEVIEKKFPEHLELVIAEKLANLYFQGKKQEMFDTANKYLELGKYNFCIYTSLYSLLLQDLKDFNSLQMALAYLKKAINITPSEEQLNAAFILCLAMGNTIELANIVKKIHEANPSLGLGCFLMGKLESLVGLSYDESVDMLKKALENGGCDKNYFVIDILPICKEPKDYSQTIKKIAHQNPTEINAANKLLLASMYLYGKFLKYNPKKALNYIAMSSNDTNNNDSILNNFDESLILLGRYNELIVKDYDTAFRCYQDAYNQNRKDILKEGVLTALFAHCNLSGIGVSKDLAKARKILLDDFYYNPYNSGDVIQLMTYLYLIGELDFDGNELLKFLKEPYLFSRYDISHEMLTKQLSEKLNLTYEFDEKNILSHESYLGKKYYKKHKNDKVYYPFITY